MNQGLEKIKLRHYNNIVEYNNNPNKCLCCNSDILCIDRRLNETKVKKFCNRICAGIYNNSKRVRIIKNKEKKKKQIVDLLDNLTKNELLQRRKNYTSCRISICKHARNKLNKLNLLKVCSNCGYDKHVEVCHIKSVSSFNNDIKISEINDVNNLMYLCPNCHWEFDNNILKL